MTQLFRDQCRDAWADGRGWGLTRLWLRVLSRKFSGSQRLKSSETMAILKGRMDLRPLRNTWLVEIRVFSDQPEEAAKLANAIARSYREWSLSRSTPVDIVDTATPGLRLVRPNKPMNIAVGIIDLLRSDPVHAPTRSTLDGQSKTVEFTVAGPVSHRH